MKTFIKNLFKILLLGLFCFSAILLTVEYVGGFGLRVFLFLLYACGFVVSLFFLKKFVATLSLFAVWSLSVFAVTRIVSKFVGPTDYVIFLSLFFIFPCLSSLVFAFNDDPSPVPRGGGSKSQEQKRDEAKKRDDEIIMAGGLVASSGAGGVVA